MAANDSLPEFRSSTSTNGYLDIEVVCDEAGEAVIFVRGELDRDTAPLLTGCVQEILDTHGEDRVVLVNLAGTTFIDVGGMCSFSTSRGWRGIGVRVSTWPGAARSWCGCCVSPTSSTGST